MSQKAADASPQPAFDWEGVEVDDAGIVVLVLDDVDGLVLLDVVELAGGCVVDVVLVVAGAVVVELDDVVLEHRDAPG